jgi:hypothetical protein
LCSREIVVDEEDDANSIGAGRHEIKLGAAPFSRHFVLPQVLGVQVLSLLN